MGAVAAQVGTAYMLCPEATTAMTPLRAKAEAEGLSDFSPLWSGQNASGCKAIPAAQLTRELAGAIQV